VNHEYVLRKLAVLGFPWKRDWLSLSRQSNQLGTMQTEGTGRREVTTTTLLKCDVEDAELYVPLMGFLTYLVLFAVEMGLAGAFKPSIFATCFEWSVFITLLETGIAKFAFTAIDSSVSFVDLLAFTSYKYVYLSVLSVVLLIMPNPLLYTSFMYFGAAAAFSAWRFLSKGLHSYRTAQARELGLSQQPGPIHRKLILVIAFLQVPLIWFMMPALFGSTTSSTQDATGGYAKAPL